MTFASLKNPANRILLGVLGLLPLGLFIIKGWTSGVLIGCAVIAVLMLLLELADKSIISHHRFWVNLSLLMFASPLLAAMLSSVLRGEWIWASFDSFSRFLFAAPIFYVLYCNKIKVLNRWQYSIPVGIIATLISAAFLPGYYGDANPFDGGRLAIYFTDPLTLGYLSLTLGVLSFFSINLFSKDSWLVLLLKILGGVIGFYISIKTQSRTGWLAIPFILILLIYVYGPKNKIASTFAAIIGATILISGIYFASSTMQNRFHQAAVDIQDYKFEDVNPETSLGERISFARIGFYYFKLSPIHGWGLSGFRAHADDPELLKFASKSTRQTSALFHSEITTNAVVHGIFGLLAILLVFFLPVALCIRQWCRGVNPRLCAFGLAYLLCEIISALSTEIFSLKFAASFHALFLACLCAQLLLEDPIVNNVSQQSS